MDSFWFKPKAYGWGVGLPIIWQGWVALLGFLLLVLAFAFVDGVFMKTVPVGSYLRFTLDIITISILFCYIFQNKVEGGLKWRWGKG